MTSSDDELVSRGDIGAFNLRLGTSKIGYLVFEVRSDTSAPYRSLRGSDHQADAMWIGSLACRHQIA